MLLLAAGMLGLGGAAGCADSDAMRQLTTSAPSEARLQAMVRRNAGDLGRVSCAGCPERWAPEACAFAEQLMRTQAGVKAARCAMASAALGPPGVPQRLPASAQAAAQASLDKLAKDTRHRDVDEALQLYAFGSDLQRMGSLELWSDGLLMRARALAWLADAPPADGWPSELLALEAAAPSPGRVAELAVVQAYGLHREHDWQARASLGSASDLSIQAIRGDDTHRAEVVRTTRQALVDAWGTDGPPVDLVESWQAGVLVRSHTQDLALKAALARERRCPDSLDALVPEHLRSVPEGWVLDTSSCLPRRLEPPQAPSGQLPTPKAGALAASP